MERVLSIINEAFPGPDSYEIEVFALDGNGGQYTILHIII